MRGKRVVVLGGTSGMGLAAAQAVTAAGGSAVVASRSLAGVDRGLSALPDGTEGHVVDMTDEPAVREFFERLGAFDHLVYTAGEPLLQGRLAELDIDAVRRFFQVRFFGAMTAVKYGAPNIRAGGSVNFIGGTASFRPGTATVAPSSVLAAIEGLTRALAVDLAPIRVNAVVPGTLRSEMWSGVPQAEREAMFDALGDRQLVGPRIGEPGDVADTFLYLMNNQHITGATITLDGGATLSVS